MRFAAALLLLLSSSAFAYELPSPTAQRKAPPGLEGLVWNKWDTKHFSVLSIDKTSGKELQSRIEGERLDALSRWPIEASEGFYCKLVCVKDADMLKKMFSIDAPRCEVRRRSDGAPDVAAIWIDSPRMNLLPSLLLEAELSFGSHPLYLKRGIPTAERPIGSLRPLLASASDNAFSSLVDAKKSKSLFEADGASFDADSALICLMVRKEFGRLRFSEVISSGTHGLSDRLGFPSQKALDETFSRYRSNLLHDLKDGKTPDDYLRALR